MESSFSRLRSSSLRASMSRVTTCTTLHCHKGRLLSAHSTRQRTAPASAQHPPAHSTRQRTAHDRTQQSTRAGRRASIRQDQYRTWHRTRVGR
eukprot:2047469-Rhodomonas_salina.1